jgi:alpha-beta hydrolase superfamily lysophospholipase
MDSYEIQIDVTASGGLGRPAVTASTVMLPDPGKLPSAPIVCFAYPGGGYSRGYYTFDSSGATQGGQAAWHAHRGWIFIACDHLGTGDSTGHDSEDDPELSYEAMALANDATAAEILARLEAGTLVPGYPPVRHPVRIGLGHSMGGCLTIIAQALCQTYDAVGILGFSAVHTSIPTKPGSPSITSAWALRSSLPRTPRILNRAALETGIRLGPTTVIESEPADEHPYAWAFHFDDEPADIVAADLRANARSSGAPLPAWRSAAHPPAARYMVTPGVVATEAACITVPVLVAAGERDVIPNLPLEALAYRSSHDVTLYRGARMAHLHNFANTRQLLWERIHLWAEAAARRHP